jgi:hypothetical protein
MVLFVNKDEKRMKEVLEEWRANIVVGKNVELEDWMVEYVASGQHWKMPEVKIYIARVEHSSLTNNRLVSTNIYLDQCFVYFHLTGFN